MLEIDAGGVGVAVEQVEVIFPVDGGENASDDGIPAVKILEQAANGIVGQRFHYFLAALAMAVDGGRFALRYTFQQAYGPTIFCFSAEFRRAQDRGFLRLIGIFTIL